MGRDGPASGSACRTISRTILILNFKLYNIEIVLLVVLLAEPDAEPSLPIKSCCNIYKYLLYSMTLWVGMVLHQVLLAEQ